MKEISLIDKYKELLQIPDSPRVLMLKGITAAAEWLEKLSKEEIVEFKQQFLDNIESSTDGDLIDLIYVARENSNPEIISIVKFFIDGDYGSEKEKIKLYAKSLFEQKKC